MIKFKEKRKTKREPTKDIVVLYHNDCTDGFSSAWVAWKKFGGKADYIGINPGTKPISGLKDKEIYMIDVIYSAEYLDRLIKENKKVIAVDHHVSNQKSFELVGEGLFDISHSAAVLAWKYFFPDKEPPKLLKHIQDMDLWKFEIPGTKEVIAYLDTVDFNFEKWSRAVEDTEDETKRKEFSDKGSFVLKYQDRLIDNIIANHAVLVDFFGHKTYAVNSPVFNSQIANILNKKLPPMGVVWVQENNGNVHVSLRSDGTVDVSELAAKFKGGGGHKKSAGFSIDSFEKLPWKQVKN